MIFLALALGASSSSLEWAEFSRAGALNHVRESVEIRTTPSVTPGRMEYELVYTRESPREKERFTADSIDCPAVRPVIMAMRGLTMPHPAPYGVEGDSGTIILDGTTYTLTAPTDFPAGTMTISSNEGSPLAAWVNKALLALQPCWAKAG